MQDQKLCHCLIQLECWSITLVPLYFIQSFVFVFEFTSAEKRLHNICSWERHEIICFGTARGHYIKAGHQI
jgi:hypothetical protein